MAPLLKAGTMTISEIQLSTMLELQDGMNSKVNPAWVAANNNWHRAIQVEGVEAIEHHGWKWWKKQECDMAQLRMELVDIWHFILSASIQTKLGNVVQAKMKMQSELNLHQKSVQFDNQNYVLAQLSLLEKLDLLVGLAAAKRTSLALFESCAARLRYGMERSVQTIRRQERAERVPPGSRIQGRNVHQDMGWSGRQRTSG